MNVLGRYRSKRKITAIKTKLLKLYIAQNERVRAGNCFKEKKEGCGNLITIGQDGPPLDALERERRVDADLCSFGKKESENVTDVVIFFLQKIIFF
jgi:hypothetical protein